MSFRTSPVPLLVVLAVAVGACSDQGPDGGSRLISGTARIVRGPGTLAGGASLEAGIRMPEGSAAAVLTEGIWGISPNTGKATIVSLAFMSASGMDEAATLTGACAPTYVRGGTSLSQILDCPFTIASGTYVGLRVGIKNEFELLIDDPVNGLYTDPAAASKLSTSRPPGGPQLVPLTIPISAGQNGVIGTTTIFTQPLQVDSLSPPVITIVADMIHTVAVRVTAGAPAFHTNQIIPVVDLVGSATGVGKVEYYNTYGTAQNVHMPNVTGISNRRVRVFYASGGQPTYLMSPIGDNPSAAYNTSPTANPSAPAGWRPGGYLGLDSNGVLCWALPRDQAYSQYAYLLRMSVPAGVGGKTTLLIQQTSTVPTPSSGNTYSGGCPSVTPTEQWNLTLVGR